MQKTVGYVKKTTIGFNRSKDTNFSPPWNCWKNHTKAKNFIKHFPTTESERKDI